MKKINKKILVTILLAFFIVLLTGSLVYICSYFYMENEFQITRNVVMAVMGSLLVLEVFWIQYQKEKLDYQNAYGGKFVRFAILYMFGIVFAVLIPILPSGGWPYMVIFTALACFSNMACGIVSGSVLLTITFLLTPDAGTEIFVLYFMSGIVAISLFQNIDESFHVGIPIVLSLLFFLVCETANVILFVNQELSGNLFVIPFVNVVISAIMLVTLLKLYNYLVVNKYRDKYQVINDQEYPVMAKLKEEHKEEYYTAIHTAYLCDCIAKRLHLDENLIKSGAYYSKCGILHGESNAENALKICKENNFPPKVREIIKESFERSPIMKESAVVILAYSIVSSIQEIFKKDNSATVNYAEVVEKQMEKKIGDQLFKDNLLTYSDVQKIRKIFVEEKLYYDFLR